MKAKDYYEHLGLRPRPCSSEPSRCGRKNEGIYYCRYCVDQRYSTGVSATFRSHLFKVDGIEVEAAEHPVKRQRDRLIQDAFAKAGEMHVASGWLERRSP